MHLGIMIMQRPNQSYTEYFHIIPFYLSIELPLVGLLRRGNEGI